MLHLQSARIQGVGRRSTYHVMGYNLIFDIDYSLVKKWFPGACGCAHLNSFNSQGDSFVCVARQYRRPLSPRRFATQTSVLLCWHLRADSSGEFKKGRRPPPIGPEFFFSKKPPIRRRDLAYISSSAPPPFSECLDPPPADNFFTL